MPILDILPTVDHNVVLQVGTASGAALVHCTVLHVAEIVGDHGLLAAIEIAAREKRPPMIEHLGEGGWCIRGKIYDRSGLIQILTR